MMTKNEILAAALSIGGSIERDIWPCSFAVAQARANNELEYRGIAAEYRSLIRVLALLHVIAGK